MISSAARDKLIARNTTHGLSKTPEYKSWKAMKERCLRNSDTYFAKYGGRGIKICERWLNDFNNFYTDMGCRPTLTHTLDRIDINGNYEPSNCKWSTPKEQNNNKTNNRIIFWNNKKYTLAELCLERKLNYSVIWDRIYRRNWLVKDAILRPIISKSKKK